MEEVTRSHTSSASWKHNVILCCGLRMRIRGWPKGGRCRGGYILVHTYVPTFVWCISWCRQATAWCGGIQFWYFLRFSVKPTYSISRSSRFAALGYIRSIQYGTINAAARCKFSKVMNECVPWCKCTRDMNLYTL